MRATVVRTAENRRILIPNAELFTGRVQVNTAYPLARASFSVLVAACQRSPAGRRHRADPAGAGHDQDPPPGVIATDLSGDGVTFSVCYWVQPPAQREQALTSGAVILAVHGALE